MMIIERASKKDLQSIAILDSHIPEYRLAECIDAGQVYVLKDDSQKRGDRNLPVVGVLRYSLFWQTIPFLDLILLSPPYRNQGFGTKMMTAWEDDMQCMGFSHVMTSTQADEEAWHFYEKRGYRRVGGFFPPDQEAEEWMYLMAF